MPQDLLRKLKQLAIISLFADDELMEKFVLKGGNAIDIAYNINERASTDVDVSMESDFDPAKLDAIKARLSAALWKTFDDADYAVFDVTLEKKPAMDFPETKEFWGGYSLTFKVLDKARYQTLQGNLASLRRQAIVVGDANRRKFQVDISKFEFCRPKKALSLSGYRIYVYTPVMVIYEKIRAICQQTVHYEQVVKLNRRGRAKDFYDIVTIKDFIGDPEQLFLPDNLAILKQIFAAKRVDPILLAHLEADRAFHEATFQEVRDAVYGNHQVEAFDFYFNEVLKLARRLKSLWNK